MLVRVLIKWPKLDGSLGQGQITEQVYSTIQDYDRSSLRGLLTGKTVGTIVAIQKLETISREDVLREINATVAEET